MDTITAIAGLGVGFLVGLTGVGGGALMTPLLTLLFGVAPVTAVGTDLWFALLTKLIGGTMHGRVSGVDWQVVRRLWAGSLPASILILLLWRWMPDQSVSGQVLLPALGVVLLLTALAMLAQPRLHTWARGWRVGNPAVFLHVQPGATVLAGALIGALVTYTSVGAGALGAALLVYLYPLRMQPARLVGTDIVHAIPLTLVAGVGHLTMGHVDLRLLGTLLLGSVPGVMLGAYCSGRIRAAALRPVIALMLFAVGFKLLV